MKQQEIIRVEEISKHFGGTTALDDVSFQILRGEIHAVVGENGAGKSTLMNILSGVIQQDAGRIIYRGEEITNTYPKKMQEMGIATVFQELNLLPNRNAAENIFAGSEPISKPFFIDKKYMTRRSEELLKLLGIERLPDGPVGRMPIATQQLIEISKVLFRKAEVVIMDEPNSALTDQETHKLFEIIRDMKGRGLTIIFISHRIEEVLKIADRITVLRNGKYVETMKTSDTDVRKVVSMMIGRSFDQMFPPRDESRRTSPEVLIEALNLSRKKQVFDVSFSARRGEILGVFGLEGSGKNALAEMLFGAIRPDAGMIKVRGEAVKFGQPFDAIKKGIAYVPSDRKQEGLILEQTIKTNMVLSVLHDIQRFGIVSRKKMDEIVERYVSKLTVRCAGIDQKIVDLSGGNQQKVVLAKNLVIEPEIIILNEPTRGIDVGAKQEIYRLMLSLANQGLCIIFISSELPEIMALSDNILVVYAGRIRGPFAYSEVSKDDVLALAVGSRN